MQKISIMIIDDDSTDRYLLKRIIKKSNFSCETFEAENGQEALDFLTNYEQNKLKYESDFPPILIFLDINMHIMGGFEFLENFSLLREGTEKYQTSVFTMLTSSERKDDIDRAHSYDFVKGYITKSGFTLDKFNEIVQTHCAKYI